jgi:ribosomal protection tetracycline resistance protein
MKTLKLGIVAHVDAGKTSLTERLLFSAGIIGKMGSVDTGNTQTDSLDLERERGITIQAGVVSFSLDDLLVYLVDTPGHSDFIGEVERALRVLDGVILVISAVEGIQTQTRVLMQTLKRLNIPTLLFVNKIDRKGACDESLIESISQKLSSNCVVMNRVSHLGNAQAAVSNLAHDVEHLAMQTGLGLCHPIFFGSAITGAGILELEWGIRHLLPAKTSKIEDPLRGVIFKIELGKHGEKTAYLSLHSGQMRVRQMLTFYRKDPLLGMQPHKEKVTSIHMIQKNKNKPAAVLMAGHIAKIKGLQNIRIGDQLHAEEDSSREHLFSPPTLNIVIFMEDKAQEPKLFIALQAMTEQDPWLNPRVDPVRHEITICLYGEVQKQVIQARLEREFSLQALFKDPKTIYIERVLSQGENLQEISRTRANEFFATIGLRVEPGKPGSGIVYRLGVDNGCIPKSYFTAIEESVRATLKRGLYGWEIIDCIVTLTKAAICPLSTASEFRKSAPLVLMQAVQRARTCVCEPISSFELEIPVAALSPIIAKLIESKVVFGETIIREEKATLLGKMPTSHVHDLERQLPGLTQGEAIFLSRFDGYELVKGKIPHRIIFDGSLVDRRKLRSDMILSAPPH